MSSSEEESGEEEESEEEEEEDDFKPVGDYGGGAEAMDEDEEEKEDEKEDEPTPIPTIKFPELLATEIAKGQYLKTRPFAEPPPESHVIESMDDLLDKCKQAKAEKWAEQYSIARIRRKLGLPVKKENMSSEQKEQIKMMFINFIKNVMDMKEKSPYLKVLYDATKDEPDEAIVLMQFLYYADANTNETDFVRIADMIAKEPNLGAWCRGLLKDPANYHDVLIECALCHLEKFIYIVSSKDKKAFIKDIIFDGAEDQTVGLTDLRAHLLGVVKRQPDVRGMTIANTIYLHNLVELTLFGKYDSPKSEELVEAWRQGLQDRMAEFPPKAYWNAVRQTFPYCRQLTCFNHAPFVCCETANYCSPACREADWDNHLKLGCSAAGKKEKKRDLDYTPLGERPNDPIPEVYTPRE